MSKEFSKTLTGVSVLEYYDGPLLFTALDPVGTRFLCSFLETKDAWSEYLCVPVSLARLNSFLNGTRDLRSNYDEPEVDEFYKIVTQADDSESLTATPIEKKEINSALLPASGYFVDSHWRELEEPEQMHSLVEVSLEVRGSKNYPAIDTYILCDFLRGVQDTIKYAVRKFSPAQGLKGRKERNDLLAKTEVYAFSHSSFSVKLRSFVTSGEMFGLGNFDQSLSMVTQLLQYASQDSDVAIEFLRENRGHFVYAVKRLLAVATSQGCALSLRWRPSKSSPVPFTKVRVPFDNAFRLNSLLAVQSELELEQATYTGTIIGISERRDAWDFRIEDGDEISGIGDPAKPDQLAGLIYKTERYKIHCTEQFTVDGTGRHSMRRVLKKIERLGPSSIS